MRFSDKDFYKSSYSPTGIPPGCVEVAMKDGTIAVRDTKDPHGGTLFFSAHEWDYFIQGVKDGEFDLH